MHGKKVETISHIVERFNLTAQFSVTIYIHQRIQKSFSYPLKTFRDPPNLSENNKSPKFSETFRN